MKYRQDWISLALEKSIISQEQAQQLFLMMEEHEQVTPNPFAWHYVLYYLGGFICIGAMSLFLTIGLQQLGAGPVFTLSAAYVAIFYVAMRYFHKSKLHTPAALSATAVVSTVPLVVYSLLWFFQVWPGLAYPEHLGVLANTYRWNWLVLEVSVVISALCLFRKYVYALLMLPLSIAIYFLLMDVIAVVRGSGTYNEALTAHSIGAGAVLLVLAVSMDLLFNQGRRYSLWFYIIGATVLWFPVTHLLSGSLGDLVIYAGLSIAMLLTGTIVRRVVFVVYGAIGCAWFLVELSHDFFVDSAFFPVALTVIGGCVVGCGLLWQRKSEIFSSFIQRRLPESVSRAFSKD